MFVIPWTAAHQASLPITTSWSLLKLMSIELVMSSSVVPFSSCLQTFPASEFFSNESVLCIRWPKSWSFSSSISPSNKYSALTSFRIDWFALLTVQGTFKSLHNPASQFKSISSLALNLLYGPIITSVHDCWKNHCFDYMDLCQQNDVSAF